MTLKRGQVPLEIGGETYTIRLGTNAMARYQEASGETITQGFAKVEDADFDAIRIRRMFWAMLDGSVTEEEAGDLMDEYGLQETAQKIGEAAKLAFPQSEGQAPGNGKSRQPTKATRSKTG